MRCQGAAAPAAAPVLPDAHEAASGPAYRVSLAPKIAVPILTIVAPSSIAMA